MVVPSEERVQEQRWHYGDWSEAATVKAPATTDGNLPATTTTFPFPPAQVPFPRRIPTSKLPVEHFRVVQEIRDTSTLIGVYLVSAPDEFGQTTETLYCSLFLPLDRDIAPEFELHTVPLRQEWNPDFVRLFLDRRIAPPEQHQHQQTA